MIVIPYLWHTVDYINEGNSPVYSCGNNAISGRKIIQYNAVYSFLINQEPRTKDRDSCFGWAGIAQTHFDILSLRCNH